MRKGSRLGPLFVSRSHVEGIVSSQASTIAASSLRTPSTHYEAKGDDSLVDRKKRHKVSKACVYCKRSHMTCDDARPCSRCLIRNIGHLCRDVASPPLSVQPTGVNSPHCTYSTLSSFSSASSTSPCTNATAIYSNASSSSSFTKDARNSSAVAFSPPPTCSVSNPRSWTTRVCTSTLSDNLPVKSYARADELVTDESSYMTSHASSVMAIGDDRVSESNAQVSQGSALSGQGPRTQMLEPRSQILEECVILPMTYLDQEAFYLSAISMNDPSLSLNGYDMNVVEDSILTTTPHRTLISENSKSNAHSTSSESNSNAAFTTSFTSSTHEPTPSSSCTASSSDVSVLNSFLVAAADPSAGGTPTERLNQVLQAKYEAGLLKPFNYPQGYARLQSYMEINLASENQRRILALLETFRPRFRAKAQSLTDLDLLFIEESFHRLLLEYDRYLAAVTVPCCIWRRTGEIVKANVAFLQLIGRAMDTEGKVSGRESHCAIYELFSEESVVNYWERYASIAFDSQQKAVLTFCLLRTSGLEVPLSSAHFISCCFSFTLRRDVHHIPYMIIGQFIPSTKSLE